ncbi:MFS transporter [Saliphagus infecundisoli]|uniref:MFS transporter n=1 Tax=Saliphagus infecundisoli TaxID=1849069 RepID=A0ABD5Q9A4_9EURY|nr:MFS transporter [Saliphagus infecundisoli]
MAAARESTPIQWRSSTVQVVLASSLLAPLGVPLLSPALPVIRDAFAISDTEVSLLVSGYFVAGIVLSPLIGMVEDRVGRRRVLVTSLFVFALSGSAIVFVPDFTTLLAIRLLQGIAAAGIFITTVTIISETFEDVQRNTVLGINTATLSIAAAVYPVLGGVLAGIAWNAPFLMYLAGLPVGLFALCALEDPPNAQKTRGIAYLREVIDILETGDTLALYTATLLAEVLMFGAIITTLPLFLTES